MASKKAHKKGADTARRIHTRERRHNTLRARLGDDPSFTKLAYRSRMVMGHGNLNADVVFVVEQPSAEDTVNLSYLSGRESPVLNHMLMCLDLKRPDVYITGLSKWTTDCRNLTSAESTRLLKYLRRELDIIRPKVVVVLGRSLVQIVTPGFDLSTELGKAVQCQTFDLIPMFHPSTALVNTHARNAMQTAMSRVAVMI